MFPQGCFGEQPPGSSLFSNFVVNPLRPCAMEPRFLSYHKRLTILLLVDVGNDRFPLAKLHKQPACLCQNRFYCKPVALHAQPLDLWQPTARLQRPEVGSAAPPALMLNTSCARARRSPPLQSDWRSPPLHDARGCAIMSLQTSVPRMVQDPQLHSGHAGCNKIRKIASQRPGAHVSLRHALQSLIWC